MTKKSNFDHFLIRNERLIWEAASRSGLDSFLDSRRAAIDLTRVEQYPEDFFIMGTLLIHKQENLEKGSLEWQQVSKAIEVLDPILQTIVGCKEKEITKWIVEKSETAPDVAELYQN